MASFQVGGVVGLNLYHSGVPEGSSGFVDEGKCVIPVAVVECCGVFAGVHKVGAGHVVNVFAKTFDTYIANPADGQLPVRHSISNRNLHIHYNAHADTSSLRESAQIVL